MKSIEEILEAIPDNFAFTVEQAAFWAQCSEDTIRRNIRKETTDRYHLKARRNTADGPWVIYNYDLKDFITRTFRNSEIRADKRAKYEATVSKKGGI